MAGLSYGLLGSVLGDAQAEYKDGALQFIGHPFGQEGSAVTLGQVIIFFEGASPQLEDKFYESDKMINMGLHELEHVAQAEKFGPFYLPAYFALGGWWTNSNPFEQGANKGALEKANKQTSEVN